MPNKFIWTDLSTFDVKSTKDFYSHLFNWQFADSQRAVEGDYHIASQAKESVAAVYTMPKLYQDYNMPSFWMSYIHVDNIEDVVAKAHLHKNVVIEIEPTAFDKESQFALIRDPAGAGFTVYQGPDLKGRFDSGHGRMVQNVLHVNDKNLVEDFYKDLFDWTFQPNALGGQLYEIIHQDGEVVAHLEELPNDIKGDKQYWMPIFAVEDKDVLLKDIDKMGGLVLMDLDDKRSLIADPQGGHFIIQQSKSQPSERRESSKRLSFKWKTIVALGVIWYAAFSEVTWIWGVLFLLWILPDLRRRETHFVEHLTAKENPILFWLLMASWLIFIVYLITTPFF